MDSNFFGDTGPSSSINGGAASASGSHFLKPNYTRQSVQDALEHLASIGLIDLCNEARVERCRATRDLRSCGRYVESALNSCGHASLCEECSKRCDLCPICRTSILKESNVFSLRPRLFYECIDAGLISKVHDDRFRETEDREEQVSADVQHLYCLFDVALENNLASLICHYVTDVCMDESAVSSDPVMAFLLDEIVVKDWCKRTFGTMIKELHGIYNAEIQEMKSRLDTLLKYSVQLAGMSNVLEVLESSFKGSLSAQINDLQLLQESILKTKQHMEVMIWCIRHEFLENQRSRFPDVTSWRIQVRERKSAAIKRAWPNAINNSEESARQEGSLFIEDALSNLEIEHIHDFGEELKVAYLQKDGISTIFRSKIEGVLGCYPFENIRAAIDILFLRGGSDMVLAKQAIFLYYLYDRHWTMPDEVWKHILEDFAASFGITRHLLLESLIFYLLDDLGDKAMQEACHLLPEISGPTTHPKIAQVLLERGNPDTALSVLRWSGRDGLSQLVSLSEAVTAVRVRVECGLLTEAFSHQRTLCTKVREKKSKGEDLNWKEWVDVLVSEICYLCIRRNVVDRMIELPWSSDEEKHLHKCLLDYAFDVPSSNVGSLLVVFYIQRYRYAQAYQVHSIIKTVEEEFLAKNSVSEEVLYRVTSSCDCRAGLVERCMSLLPNVQRQEVIAGKFPELTATSGDDVEVPPDSDLSKSTSLLIPSSNLSSLAWTDHTAFQKPPAFETPQKRGGSFEDYRSETGPHHSSLRATSYNNTDLSKNKNLKSTVSPFKGVNRTPSRVVQSSNLRENQLDELSPEIERNRSLDRLENASPYVSTFTANPITTPSSNRGLLRYSSEDFQPSVTSKRAHPSDDLMDVSWSNGHKDFAAGEVNGYGGSRWRSDDTSDEEDERIPTRSVGPTKRPTRGVRRSARLAKR